MSQGDQCYRTCKPLSLGSPSSPSSPSSGPPNHPLRAPHHHLRLCTVMRAQHFPNSPAIGVPICSSLQREPRSMSQSFCCGLSLDISSTHSCVLIHPRTFRVWSPRCTWERMSESSTGSQYRLRGFCPDESQCGRQIDDLSLLQNNTHNVWGVHQYWCTRGHCSLQWDPHTR